MPATYHLPHLRTLEAEAVHVMREVAAEFERPVLLFSGGKDSIVLLRLAEKAFRPGGFPFPVMHVDTGHNLPEADEFGQWEPQRQRPEVWSRRRCGAYTMDASARGSTRGSFRSPTGPSSTCGST